MLDGTRQGYFRFKPQQGIKSFWLSGTESLMGCGVSSVKTSEVPAEVKPLVCSPTLASFPDFLAHLIIEEMPHTLTAH